MDESGAQVAGRLSVVVESSLKGFRQKLKKKLEEETRGIAAKVGVEIDADSLRADLKSKVAEAAKGVTATIGVDLDVRGLPEKLRGAAAAASAGTTATIGVDADTGSVTPEVVAAAAAAEAAAPTVTIGVRARTREFFKDIFKARAAAAAAGTGIGDIGGGGGAGGGLFGGGGRGPRMRTLVRGGAIFSLLSLIQPAVGAIGQLVAGLTAMVGAAAPAVGVMSAFPIAISGFIQAMAAGKIATQGLGDAMGLLAEKQATLARGEKFSVEQQEKLNQVLGELSPSARKFAAEVVGLRGEWVKMRMGVQEALFSRIAGEIRPLAERLLPMLQKQLSGTAARLGDAAAAGSQFLQTRSAQSDIGKVMSNNNIIFTDFLYMIGQFGQGTLDFLVASRKFGRGMGNVMRDVGDWFSDKAARGRRTGSTADFLETAAEKATQLWEITRQIGGGLAGIFRAATPSGERLLATFEDFVTEWHDWVDSTQGQNYLTAWFDGAESGFIELSRLVNEAFKGMAKWAADPKIAGLIRQIRTELGPALAELLESLADDAAPGVIDFLTNLTVLLKNLEPAIEVVSLLTQALNGMLGALNALADINPDVTANVARLLGGLFLMRSIGKIGKGGGMLAGLLGGGKGAKGGGKGGLFASLLAGFGLGSKSGGTGAAVRGGLLKKAGLIGLLITAADAAAGMKGSYDLGQEIGGRLADGYGKGVGSNKARRTVERAWRDMVGGNQDGEWWNSWNGNNDANDALEKFGIDVPRLKAEIAKYGSVGDYYQEVMGDLKRKQEGFSGWSRNLLGDLPLVDTDPEEARDLEKVLKNFATKVDTAIAEVGNRKGPNFFDAMFGSINTALTQPQIDKWTGTIVKGYRAALAAASSSMLNDKGADQLAPKAPTNGSAAARAAVKGPALDAGYRTALERQITSAWNPKGVLGTVRQSARTTTEVYTGAVRRGLDGTGKRDLFGGLFKGGKKQAADMGRSVEGATKKANSALKTMSGQARKADSQFGDLAKGVRNAGNTIRTNASKIETGVSKALEGVGRNTGRGMKRVVDATRDGMKGAVAEINKAKGPAGRASKGVTDATSAPAKGLRPTMAAAGTNAMAGLAAGIRSRGQDAIAAARAIAARVASITREELEIRSPSRVMKRIGAFVSQGFAEGIQGNLNQVNRAVKQLWKMLENKGISDKRIKQLKARFADEIEAIKKNAKAREALQKEIDKAEEKLEDLKSRKANLKAAFKNGAEEFGSIANIARANGGFLSPKQLISDLKRRLKDAKRYQDLLDTLRGKGLGEEAYTQLVELGFEEGLPLAEQLAKGSKADMDEINSLQGAITKVGKNLGEDSSKTFFDAAIDAAEAWVEKLKDYRQELIDIAEDMADALVWRVLDALGLNPKGPAPDDSVFDDPTGDHPNPPTPPGTPHHPTPTLPGYVDPSEQKKKKWCKRCKCRHVPGHHVVADGDEMEWGVANLGNGGRNGDGRGNGQGGGRTVTAEDVARVAGEALKTAVLDDRNTQTRRTKEILAALSGDVIAELVSVAVTKLMRNVREEQGTQLEAATEAMNKTAKRLSEGYLEAGVESLTKVANKVSKGLLDAAATAFATAAAEDKGNRNNASNSAVGNGGKTAMRMVTNNPATSGAPTSATPLVGEVNFNGVGDQTSEVLDELMWELKTLQRGGTYAGRLAG